MSDVIYLYQAVEEIHSMTDEPNDDITYPSEYIHKTYKKAIDELYNKGYRYKTTEDEREVFFKVRRKERTKYDDTYIAYIKQLSLPKNEITEDK